MFGGCIGWRVRFSCVARILVRLKDLAATDSPASWDAVPWALRVFTAEFGMGSGALPLAIATKSFERTFGIREACSRAGPGPCAGMALRGVASRFWVS